MLNHYLLLSLFISHLHVASAASSYVTESFHASISDSLDSTIQSQSNPKFVKSRRVRIQDSVNSCQKKLEKPDRETDLTGMWKHHSLVAVSKDCVTRLRFSCPSMIFYCFRSSSRTRRTILSPGFDQRLRRGLNPQY